MEERPLAGKFETGATNPAVPHLDFVDGLRACAALYVVLHHGAILLWGDTAPKPIRWLLGHGHLAVTVFIVISGYCLALPVVRSNRTLIGGAGRFFKRRARRILPPYYAAFALTLITWFVFDVNRARTLLFHGALFRKSILLHLLLVHNLSAETQFTLNGPLWSVATEIQIYLCFPLIVILWRRLGTAALIAITLPISGLLFVVTRHIGNLNYLFIFVLGLWASELSVRRFQPPYLIALLATCLLALPFLSNETTFMADLLVGVAAASFMALCTTMDFRPRVLLSLRPLTWLGGFSYSLYLTHALALEAWSQLPVAGTVQKAGSLVHVLALLVVLVGAIAVAYLFHRLFERPFIDTHKKITFLAATSSQSM